MSDSSRGNWENRSLLSLRGEDEASAPDEPLLSRRPAVYRPPQPAARDMPASTPPAEPERQDRKAAQGGGLRSLFGRMKGWLPAHFPRKLPAPRAAPAAPAPGADRQEAPPARQPGDREVAGAGAAGNAPPPPYASSAAVEDVYWRPIIDPVRVVSGILWARWLIVLTTLLGAVAGVLIALATPKEYYSGAEILFDPRDLQLSDRELTRDNLPSDATLALIENQVAIIMSSFVLDEVVERLNLAEDPEFNGQGGSTLGVLLNPRALLSFGGGGAASHEARWALAVRNLAEKLNVSRNERTFIIHIGASSEDAEKSALIANTTAEVYLEQTGEIHQRTADRVNTELTQRLDELKLAVETAERAVAEFKAEHDIVDVQGRLITDDEIVRLNDQLSTARARTAELNARAASTRDLDVDDVLGGALPEQVSSPVMTELLAQYAALRQQADRAATRFGPRHPENQALQAELAGVREAIAGELRRVSSSIQVELQRAVQLEQDLAARLARLKVEKGDAESDQVRLRELEREAAARRAVYESYLLRARETGQQRTLNTANATIISAAYPALLPSGPSRASIAIAGTVLGFLAGIAIGATKGAVESLRENMDGRRPAPRRPSHPEPALARRRDEDPSARDDGDLDPPPAGPGPVGGRHSGAAGMEAGGPGASQPHHDRAGRLAPSSAFAPAADNDAAALPGGREPTPLERIRHDLRAVREEIDALARQRLKRRA